MTYTLSSQIFSSVYVQYAALEGVTVPVLIILGALWAAVLVPPLLRARADKKGGGIGGYANSIGVLNNTTRNNSARPRTAAALVDPAMHSNLNSKSAMIKKRRRDVLIGMLGACGITFILALATGSTMLWFLHLLCDVVLGGYVYLLIQIKEQQANRKSTNQK